MKLSLANILLLAIIAVSLIAAITMNSSVKFVECKARDGHIFIDCVDPAWQGISSWEVSYFDESEYSVNTLEKGDLVEWEIIDDKDPSRGRILDVRYSNAPANGRLRFHVKGAGQSRDLSAYVNGALEFDVKVLDWGRGENVLIAKVLCGYPCGSEPYRIDGISLNRWTAIKIPTVELIDSGLDITKVDIGLAISPTWNRMQGIHFRLDNIRWVKGLELDPESTDPAA